MPDNTLQYLDFFKILDLIKSYVQTPYGTEDVLNLRPIYELEKIKERQEIVSEIYELLIQYGKPPLSGIPDIRDLLKKLSIENSILDPKEFLLIADFLQGIKDVVFFLRKPPRKGNYISRIIEGFDSLPEVTKKIRRTINHEGYLEDSASYHLTEVRRELYAKRTKIKRYLEKLMENERFRSLLQDNYITVRNGRYVIPMKPNFNQAVDGIVHDYSHTLKTSFVEPVECIELNNEINILEKMEKEEEERILRELTSYVNGYIRSMHRNVELLKELDLFSAVSSFAIDFNCVKPEVTSGGDLYIKNAINPLLRIYKGDGAVPIDINLKEKKSALIVSGPNAGGKTVALKTIGLLIVMAYCGLYIPASGVPQIPLYRRVYALIGDEQDFSRDLSSFTSHIFTIKSIYEESQGGEIILIDEIGGGTDPQEASALSMGIIDAFVEKGCKVVVTTHLSHLKGYGFTKEFAENVACAYDTDRMRPLYRLVYGTVGMSNALYVAKNAGLPEHVIDKSLNYIGKQEYMINNLLDSLKKEKEKLEREKEEVLKLKWSLTEKIKAIREKKEEILRRIEERYRNKIERLEAQIEEIEKEISKKEKVSLKRAKEMIAATRREAKVEGVDGKEELELKVGDFVRIKSLGSVGYISDTEDELGEFEVVIGNIRTRISREKLEKIGGVEHKIKKESADVQVVSEKIGDWKLNIRGMNVEDALESLDRFMDRAILNGVSQVRIVHGIGTGKLMSKVKEYLSRSGYVSDFKLDERNPGVTVVHLK